MTYHQIAITCCRVIRSTSMLHLKAVIKFIDNLTRDIFPRNIQGFNINGNNIKQCVPSMHCFEQHNSSISNYNTRNNQAMNVN